MGESISNNRTEERERRPENEKRKENLKSAKCERHKIFNKQNLQYVCFPQMRKHGF